MPTFTCPCCGYKTLSSSGEYDICLICFWEDDPTQRKEPDSKDGANKVSLKQGQKNFREFGACDRDVKIYVQAPTPDDQKDPDWKPLA